MTVDESNEELLTNLGSRIRELVLSKTNKLSAFMQTPQGMSKLSNIRKDDVVLVKFSEKGYENVNMKVYASNAIGNPMNCKFKRDVEVNGMVSGESIHPEKMAETSFTGIYVFELVNFFVGSVKTI